VRSEREREREIEPPRVCDAPEKSALRAK